MGRSKSSYFSASYDSLLNGSDALNNLMQPIGSCIRTLQELFRENCIKGKLQNCIECQYHKSIIRWNITNCIYSKQHIIDVIIETPVKNYFIYFLPSTFFPFYQIVNSCKILIYVTLNTWWDEHNLHLLFALFSLFTENEFIITRYKFRNPPDMLRSYRTVMQNIRCASLIYNLNKDSS